MQKYFKVKYGYGANDFYEIGEDEVQTAIRAQIRGTVALLKVGTISGNSIIAVMPDLEKWLRLSNFEEVPVKIREEHHTFLKHAEQTVRNQLAQPSHKELKSGQS